MISVWFSIPLWNTLHLSRIKTYTSTQGSKSCTSQKSSLAKRSGFKSKWWIILHCKAATLEDNLGHQIMKFCHEKEQYFKFLLNNEIGSPVMQNYPTILAKIHFSKQKHIWARIRGTRPLNFIFLKNKFLDFCDLQFFDPLLAVWVLIREREGWFREV